MDLGWDEAIASVAEEQRARGGRPSQSASASCRHNPPPAARPAMKTRLKRKRSTPKPDEDAEMPKKKTTKKRFKKPRMRDSNLRVGPGLIHLDRTFIIAPGKTLYGSVCSGLGTDKLAADVVQPGRSQHVFTGRV